MSQLFLLDSNEIKWRANGDCLSASFLSFSSENVKVIADISYQEFKKHLTFVINTRKNKLENRKNLLHNDYSQKILFKVL